MGAADTCFRAEDIPCYADAVLAMYHLSGPPAKYQASGAVVNTVHGLPLIRIDQ